MDDGLEVGIYFSFFKWLYLSVLLLASMYLLCDCNAHTSVLSVWMVKKKIGLWLHILSTTQLPTTGKEGSPCSNTHHIHAIVLPC